MGWRGSTFRFVITAPVVRFDKETMTLTVIKPRVLYQKKGGYEVKKGSFNKGAAKEKVCKFASGLAYKGKVPQFGGEGTLKEYPEAYKKIFPMTRGGLLAAGQQCDDESKCDSACPDGSNECWKQGSCPDTFNWIENAPALIGLLGLLGLLGIDEDLNTTQSTPPNGTAVP